MFEAKKGGTKKGGGKPRPKPYPVTPTADEPNWHDKWAWWHRPPR